MKKILLLILLIVVSISAFTIEPNWLRNVPHHQSDLYECIVVQGRGLTKEEADREVENKIVRIVHDRTGTDFHATIRLTPYSTYYSRDYDGMILVSCLYVVAVNAEDFRASKEMHQGVPKGTHSGIINDLKPSKKKNEKPEYWDSYKSKLYETVYKQSIVINNKEELLRLLTTQAIQELKNRITLPDTTEFGALIYPDYYFSQKEKTIYVLASIRKENIANLYFVYAAQIQKRIEDYIADARDKENTNDTKKDWIEIKALYEAAEKELQKFDDESVLKSLTLYGASEKRLSQLRNDLDNLNRDIQNGLSRAKTNAAKEMALNLSGWLKTAYEAEKQLKLASALEYFYGSLVYWEKYLKDDDTRIYLKYKDGVNLKELSGNELKVWLINHIRFILSNTKIICVRQNKAEGLLYFYWPDSTQSLVTDVAYYTNTGNGDSHLRFSENGINCWASWSGQVYDILVGIDYRSTTFIGPTALKQVLEDNSALDNYKFHEAALHVVKVMDNNNLTDFTKPDTDVAKNLITEKSSLSSEQLSLMSDKKRIQILNEIISSVCKSLNTKDYLSIRNLFTEKGYDLFCRLVANGTITTIHRDPCDYIEYWNEVYARSIAIKIKYSHKKEEVLENVVLVFTPENKIDGIQFAADPRTIADVNSHKEWNDNVKYAIINFLENYRTAYALKRLDYIADVFADDAIIIVGRVISHPAQLTDGGTYKSTSGQPLVVYSHPNKPQYLRCLERHFKNNEWINIRFTSANISQPGGENGYFGINLKQEYRSQHYGDTGYLFLVVDMDSAQHPVIHLRAWTPYGTFGLIDYERIVRSQNNTKKL